VSVSDTVGKPVFDLCECKVCKFVLLLCIRPVLYLSSCLKAVALILEMPSYGYYCRMYMCVAKVAT